MEVANKYRNKCVEYFERLWDKNIQNTVLILPINMRISFARQWVLQMLNTVRMIS